MSDQQSVCVGCKWAEWTQGPARGGGGGVAPGSCRWGRSALPPVLRIVAERWIYKDGDNALLSCPVRKPLKAQP